MGFSTGNTIQISSSFSKSGEKSFKNAPTLEMPKVEEFCPSRASGSNDHLTEDSDEAAQFCIENEYEDDEFEIVNPTRSRPRLPKIRICTI